jgi:CRISPR-associated protein Cas8a1/Csx13
MVKLSLDLREPSMTCLHRAGVAGLFHQLRYLNQINCQPPHGLNWSLTAQTIELDWTGTDRDALEWLCSESFQIDNDGLIYFPAIANSWNFRQRLTVHNSLRKTFLQHHQFCKSGPELIKIDRQRETKYKSCQSYAHQKGADFICGKGKDKLQSQPIKTTGWIYPGGTVKHYALGKATQLVETAANFVALMFAPLACAYVSIIADFDAEAKSQNFLTTLIIPEVTNLEEYLQSQNLVPESEYNYRSSGWAEAGLRFLLQTTTHERLKRDDILRCQVVSFGVVAWSKQQHTRVGVESIAIDTEYLARYQDIDRLLRSHDSFTNPLLQFIAENLIRGKPWWWNFADASIGEKVYRAIKHRQQQLDLMIKTTQWDTETQKLFVQVCHQALKITFAKIYARTKDGYYPQIERELLQLRSDLDRCHNASAFRDFITAFWGNAGTIKVLQDRWEEMLPLTTGAADWKMAKSLVLLALASYKPELKPVIETETAILTAEQRES